MSPPPGPLDDVSFASVLVAARAGDQWAAEVLFVDLQPRLLRFLRSVEPRAADDLAGEVWLGIAQGLSTFEGDLTGFRAWVFTIARRRLADHRRTAGRRATDPVDPHEHFRLQPDPATIDGARADTATAVIGRLSAQEAVDLISSSLPPDQAEVLLLRVVGDLDVAHVAEVLDRTPNWVRVTQHRALRKLAEKFSGNVDDSVMTDPPQAI
ncbi:MAG: RNA polymerase sigma factor [Actinobacteria bacterium]|nr:RNA polymerase sigma factor [Actinomycetota bacterium]